MGEASRGTPITPIYALFYVGSPEGNPLFLRGEDFSGFFLEPFPGAIITATVIPTVIITIITPLVIITTAIIATAIGGTLIRVKVFPFGEIF